MASDEGPPLTGPSYEPIDCGVHDVLEAAAVRRTLCVIRWTEGKDVRRASTTIDDLYARDGAEYAVLGEGSVVRLDRLLDIRPT